MLLWKIWTSEDQQVSIETGTGPTDSVPGYVTGYS